MSGPQHVFSSTRRGVPLGERADFSKCDECGEGPNAPAHRISDEMFADALALDLEGGPEGEAFPVKLPATPCGVRDETAKVLEPNHYDCAGCRALVKVRLMYRSKRVVAPPKPAPTQGDLLGAMTPDAPKRGRRKR